VYNINQEQRLMPKSENEIEVYLEVGETRTFAVALGWPGWCRSARDEGLALNALYDYAPRYARAIQPSKLAFPASSKDMILVVVDRQPGNATTDFGAPDLTLPRDEQAIKPADLERWQAILTAIWAAFDASVKAAKGRALAKGPRGGGRELDKIVEHVRDSDSAYVSALGGKAKINADTPAEGLAQVHEAILTTLTGRINGEIPERGPRGGLRWTPRYFVRRHAWHQLDHAWEIEDRAK
jgi:hypothetical protein